MNARETCLEIGHLPQRGFNVTMCGRCGAKLETAPALIDELRLAGIAGTTITINGRQAALIAGLLDLLVSSEYGQRERVVIEARVQELLKEEAKVMVAAMNARSDVSDDELATFVAQVAHLHALTLAVTYRANQAYRVPDLLGARRKLSLLLATLRAAEETL